MLTEIFYSVKLESMNSGQTIRQRAAWHAALGDPVRLRIAELLAVSDYSHSELQSALGVASNLLAHHLRVLRQCGMTFVTPSEGDRRRRYVHLAPEVATMITGCTPRIADRLVFVCSGNSARSPVAAALWNRSHTPQAISAGTRPAERTSPGAQRVAASHGLSIADHQPQQLEDTVKVNDMVITLCDRAHELLSRSGAAEQTITALRVPRLHWSIPDPHAESTTAAHERVLTLLSSRITATASLLTTSDPSA